MSALPQLVDEDYQMTVFRGKGERKEKPSGFWDD